MKILYVGTATTVEFMSDSIFHGLRSLFGNDVVDAVKISHMYIDYSNNVKSMHGRGFTLSKTLVDDGVDRTDLTEKIRKRYFDYVIYGASYRQDSLQYIQSVIESYPSNKIVFINGADSWQGTIEPELLNVSGVHFLREKFTNNHTYPISFSIPKESIVTDVPQKEYYLMPLVPGVESTYIYNSQDDYYNMYRKSLFGLTWKKAGWDCLRHYEILSQGCLPLFLDIHHIPQTVMTTYPKEQLSKLLDVAVKIPEYRKDMQFVYDQRMTISNIDYETIEYVNPDNYGYYDIAHNLLQYTKEYLTTEYQAQLILKTLRRL